MNVFQILSAHSEFIHSDILIAMTKGTTFRPDLSRIFMRHTTIKCIYRYVNLLHYEQRSLLRVSVTYCDHLQGGVL